ncbi:FG-GAP repeat domain-containing protein [Sciscionella sediminilitoris]|uniref:FG-GAP repeat domain-containing protein n=1 Tax=Sciscionella sediminilitoris TaxID=1445613 RepID=UPI0004DF67F3|nr:VCBS repeat-containing protein [Sciscionella sp. SE31]
MRKHTLSLRAVLGAVLLAAALALVAAVAPASAETAWFAPKEVTGFGNTLGPGPAPRGSVTGDFNSDGKADVVSIADFTIGRGLLFTPGKGDGTWGRSTQIPGTGLTIAGGGTQGLDAGDLNGDGHLDLVVQNLATVSVLLGDGHGKFRKTETHVLPFSGQIEPRVADLNGDKAPDIVAPSFGCVQALSVSCIRTLINNGDGSFRPGPQSRVDAVPVLSAISPATLNRDGKPDLFATDGLSGTTYALLGNGDGSFRVSGKLPLSGLIPEDVAAADLNGDGCDDVAAVGSFSFSLTTALTDCSGGFTTKLGKYHFGGAGPTSVNTGDFNGDGRPDLAVSSLFSLTPAVKIFAGDGTAQLREIGDYQVGWAPQNPLVADFTGDGKPDIVTVGVSNLALLRNITAG